jgi:hypothetical protein
LCQAQNDTQHVVAFRSRSAALQFELPQSPPPGRGYGAPGVSTRRWGLRSAREESVYALPGSFFVCCNCGQKTVRKLAQIYARWNESNGASVGWKQRYCADCLTLLMGSLLEHRSDESLALTVCPRCGCDASEDLDPIWLNVYVPKQPERVYALTMCESCATLSRDSLTANATRLPDRTLGPKAPETTPETDWDKVPW